MVKRVGGLLQWIRWSGYRRHWLPYQAGCCLPLQQSSQAYHLLLFDLKKERKKLVKLSATFRKEDNCLTDKIKKRTLFFKYFLTTAGFAKVKSHQLDHVGLKKVDVPPGRTLHFGQTACFRREEIAGATIDSSLRNTASSYTRLHGRLTGRYVQNWKRIRSGYLSPLDFVSSGRQKWQREWSL